ncbi:hypothetical protein [Acetobacter malorum]|uniref:hypothetical protein n=1 Tax=Acetobacter malorum TaxID=178901 RepID=UPI00248F1BA5|nr:hypothetical protein [Acetobacter malorum]
MSNKENGFPGKELHALLSGRNRIIVFLVISFSIFLVQAYYGFGYHSFGDESGHDIGGWAIEKGDVLYRDYIDAHGPLVFFTTWLLGKVVGYKYAFLFRLNAVFITLLAAFGLYYASNAPSWRERLLSPALFLGLLGPVWIIQALNMNGYWIFGGDLTVLAGSLLVVPALLDVPVKKWGAVGGGAALALLPFVAYSFLPVTFLFTLCLLVVLCRRASKLSRTDVVYGLAGAFGAFAIFLVWMLVYADLKGFVVYHFINNQFYYAHYIPFSFGAVLKSLRPSVLPENLVQTLAVLTLLIGSLILMVKTRYKLAALIAIAGLFSLDARGGTTFHDGAFVVAALGLVSQMLPVWLDETRYRLSSCAGVLVACSLLVGLHAVSSPFGEDYVQRKRSGFHPFMASNDLIDQKIRQYAHPDERILVLPYNPNVYIEADRLPIKKYHDYLPWEADYAKHPVKGYERDICVDLPKALPPVIYFNNWTVWGLWKPEQFMGCAVQILQTQYGQLPGIPDVYVRKDRLAQ